jgi:hypothetical protein
MVFEVYLHPFIDMKPFQLYQTHIFAAFSLIYGIFNAVSRDKAESVAIINGNYSTIIFKIGFEP